MKKITLFFVLSFFQFSCKPAGVDSLKVDLDENYPRWIEAGETFTQQTSGIAFISENQDGKNFILADDIGDLYRFIIKNDTVFTLKKIFFAEDVTAFLSTFPKQDFEEIFYDRYTGKIYLSIEGNEPQVKNTAGIYELGFADNNIYADSVVWLNRIIIDPWEEFQRYTADNVGFEGAAADEKYFYFALEGFSENDLFADSTLIYIVEKNSLTIKKIINTKKMGIGTICGLYSDKNSSLYGTDRNNRSLFHINFSDDLSVEKFSIVKLPASVPGYKNFNYVVSYESVTMDNSGALYLIDDPWKKHYIPSKEILSKLDDNTVAKFKSFIPAVYKFNLIN